MDRSEMRRKLALRDFFLMLDCGRRMMDRFMWVGGCQKCTSILGNLYEGFRDGVMLNRRNIPAAKANYYRF